MVMLCTSCVLFVCGLVFSLVSRSYCVNVWDVSRSFPTSCSHATSSSPWRIRRPWRERQQPNASAMFLWFTSCVLFLFVLRLLLLTLNSLVYLDISAFPFGYDCLLYIFCFCIDTGNFVNNLCIVQITGWREWLLFLLDVRWRKAAKLN